MNMFKCVLASGTGNGIPLIVTCASAFAGLTITCTDGTTTLTDTCPSSSPYEITFNLPNTGTWTVSGVIGGQTYTESIIIQDFNVELKYGINVSVDFYSAANDTVSYTGAVDGRTHTIITDSTGHARAVITIPVTGTASITFTSSVAKDTTDLSSDYSKTVSLTSSTTSIYLMPDNVLYWWGYKANNNIINTSASVCTPTYNTNSINVSLSPMNLWQKALSFNPLSITITQQNLIGLPNANSNSTLWRYAFPKNPESDTSSEITTTANKIFKKTRALATPTDLYMYSKNITGALTLDIYALWFN